jgi:hypothetical protein
MKTTTKLSLAFLLALCARASTADADIFAIQTSDQFEACLNQTHLLEVVRTSGGEQARMIDKATIQERCMSTAESFLKKRKKATSKAKEAKAIGLWLKVAFKNGPRDNAIGLIALQAAQDPRRCNDSAVYDVFLSIMSFPRSDDKKSLFQRAKGVIGTCLQNKQFKTDFLSEQDATRTSFQYKNICEVLKSKKLIKKCLPGK